MQIIIEDIFWSTLNKLLRPGIEVFFIYIFLYVTTGFHFSYFHRPKTVSKDKFDA